MTDYASDKLIAVDIDEVMRDPALTDLKDGPAKAFLITLGLALDRHHDGPPPMLIVRRA